GPRGLGDGGVAGARQPHGVERDDRDDRRQRDRGGGQWTAVAHDELAQAIAGGVGPRLERLAGHEAIDVADGRLYRAIAPRRILVHRGQAHHVEIRPLAGAGGGAAVTVTGASRGRRRPRRLLLDDDRFGFGGGTVRQIEGQTSREQLVEHDSQRVDVG